VRKYVSSKLKTERVYQEGGMRMRGQEEGEEKRAGKNKRDGTKL
jgi:hypothetical protein